MPANQRPTNPLPGTPLFDSPADGMAWMAKHRPGLRVGYSYQRGAGLWAARELPADHPLRKGAIIFGVNRRRSEKPQSHKPGEE